MTKVINAIMAPTLSPYAVLVAICIGEAFRDGDYWLGASFLIVGVAAGSLWEARK